MTITYRVGGDLDVDDVIEVYRESTLADRPLDDRERMGRMLENASVTVTAWDGEKVVGIARSITDWNYCTYLSDLAVRKSHQRQGIGSALDRKSVV